MIKATTRFSALIVAATLVCLPAISWAANPYQSRNMHFGVSGGNVNDITRAFCCSGTLGSLLTDGTTQYILSNNHVLARQDQAAAGEDISQPGLIDNGCKAATIVADYTRAVTLGNNVDCAIAALRSGTMDSSGFIEGIGTINSVIASPTVGMAVIKSGRTTGTTTGTVGSINTSVNVQYQIHCGSGKKYTVSYTNQVVINSTSFSAGGDSGSLILTNDTHFHPVALLFAGSSSTTIGNPIGEVLSKLGGSLSFVGSPTKSPAQALQVPQESVDQASRVLEHNRHDLMSRPGVLGTGIGQSDNNSKTAAIVVYVDQTAAARPQLPAQIDGVAVKVHLTDPFVAF
jgi:hypothetical protein